MKSINTKIVLFVGCLFVAVCLALSITSYINASRILQEADQESIQEVAKQSASTIEGMISANFKELEAVAAREGIYDFDNYTKEQKIQILYNEALRVGCQRMTIIDLNGDSFNGNGKEQNVGDREYFTKGVAGETNLTDPTIGKSTGDLLVFFATPIKRDGKIIGVLQEVTDGTKLSELTNEVSFGTNGFAYMVSAKGTIIAHPDNETVMNSFNILTAAEEDAAYASYAQAVKTALADKNGYTSYTLNGVEKIIGFAQVEGTDWELIVEIDKAELLSGLSVLKAKTIGASIFFIILGIGASFAIAISISKGIKASSDGIKGMSEGDLKFNPALEKYLTRRDEVGGMARAMSEMSENLCYTIGQIKEVSGSIDEQTNSLTTAAGEISIASQTVASAIAEVSNGTTAQSQDLTEISSILEKFGRRVLSILDEIVDVNNTSKGINDKAAVSSKEMQNLSESVEKVGVAFDDFRAKIDTLGTNITNIDQFTSVITAIASQTNLLALNASIEAARAGEAGRGFAVVAEEIKALAEQTQTSSKQISDLVSGISAETTNIIENTGTMDAELKHQSEVIAKSIESFKDIISGIEEVLPKIKTVNDSMTELDKEKEVIITNVNNVSAVATEVSASAEEISATAEEMSASIQEMADIALRLKGENMNMRGQVDSFIVE